MTDRRLREAEPLSRQKLAKLAHLSPAAFSRYFHVRTGRTLPDYINERRTGRERRVPDGRGDRRQDDRPQS